MYNLRVVGQPRVVERTVPQSRKSLDQTKLSLLEITQYYAETRKKLRMTVIGLAWSKRR